MIYNISDIHRQQMGICPSLSPQERANKQNNKLLQKMLLDKLKDLTMYSFVVKLRNEIPNMQNRYMFSEGILEDIDQVLEIIESKKSIKSQSLAIDTIEDELKNSCLIIEDEVYQEKNQINSRRSMDGFNSMHENTQYQRNLADNESLVCQINIIYQREFDITKYHNALKLFLKWSTIFTQHFYGGFLKPIYKQFCQSLYQLPAQQLDTIVDQTGVFVQYMVSVYTEIYHLKTINQSENGSLFKNQNVFNLIMASMFKKTKIKKFIRRVIRVREEKKIKQFQSKLKQFKNKDIDFFGVQVKFQLKQPNQSPSLNLSTQGMSQKLLSINKQQKSVPTSYSSCLKQLQSLCDNSQTPITKLKLIVNISKNITSQIYQYYDKAGKQVPDLDPDNLTGIIMYLIAKINKPELYEELKIAEYFTTSNCLTCISGYYLNTFNAAIETMLTMDVKQSY